MDNIQPTTQSQSYQLTQLNHTYDKFVQQESVIDGKIKQLLRVALVLWIACFGIFVGLWLAKIGKLYWETTTITKYLFIVSFIFIATAVVCLLALKQKWYVYKDEIKPNLTQWQNVAYLGDTDVYHAILEEDNILKDTMHQNILKARQIQRKNDYYNWALRLLIIGIFPPLVVIFAIMGAKSVNDILEAKDKSKSN